MRMSDRKYCTGCRDDFYNGQGAEECWLRKKAKVVKRWKIGWWTQPDRANFTKVTTYDCHHAPGKYQLSAKLPRHLGGDAA